MSCKMTLHGKKKKAKTKNCYEDGICCPLILVCFFFFFIWIWWIWTHQSAASIEADEPR